MKKPQMTRKKGRSPPMNRKREGGRKTAKNKCWDQGNLEMEKLDKLRRIILTIETDVEE